MRSVVKSETRKFKKWPVKKHGPKKRPLHETTGIKHKK